MTSTRVVAAREPAAATLPKSLRQQVARRARSTPGRFGLLLAGTVVALLVTGLVAVLGVGGRAATLDDVTARSGPLSSAAVQIYRSLSDADATAATAFLAGGQEPQALRDRYQNDVAQAAAALTTAAAGAPTGDSAATVRTLSTYLPVYTGLVETARTYNRQQVALGAAYLREASGVVRETMLPAAQHLYRIESDRLTADQRDAGGFAWITLLLGLLTLAGLVAAQIYLTQRTNRVFNVGLVAATVATVVAVIWLSAAAASAAGHIGDARRDGSAQVEALSEARIAALQARADESQTLIARGSEVGRGFEDDFNKVMTDLLGSLGHARTQTSQPDTRSAIDQATQAAGQWLTAHKDVRTADDERGDYNGAVDLVIGEGAMTTSSLAIRLDDRLGQAIDQASGRFGAATDRAHGALSGLTAGVSILILLAVLGAILGVRRRLAEYR